MAELSGDWRRSRRRRPLQRDVRPHCAAVGSEVAGRGELPRQEETPPEDSRPFGPFKGLTACGSAASAAERVRCSRVLGGWPLNTMIGRLGLGLALRKSKLFRHIVYDHE